MDAQHKTTLYIGIGGTGCHILSLVKKHFEDEFGQSNIPDYIRFLAIDTELSYVEELRECYYRLNCDGDLSQKYLETFVKNKNPEHYYYFRNHKKTGASCGTGADRAWGRLLLEIEGIRFFHRCREILHQLYYQNGFCRGVEVRMLVSLAGGTGSGIFIPLAAFLSQINGPDIYGYAVLPNAFCHSSFASRILERKFESNTCASILELDYVQHASVSNPITIKVCGQEINICTPPFQDVCFIENISESGIVIKEIGDLFRTIALSAYSSSFNTKQIYIPSWVIQGQFSISDKKAWVRGIGACEVFYNGEAMAELWSHMAAKEILGALLRKVEDSMVRKYIFEFKDMYDMNTLDNFLDRVSMHYQELSSKGEFVPRTTAAKDIRYEVDAYIDVSILSNHIKDIGYQAFDASLYDFVSGVFNDTHSIVAVCKSLEFLKYTIEIDQQELELRSLNLKDEILKYETSLNHVLDVYQNLSAIFILLNKRVTADYINDIIYYACKLRCIRLAVLRNEIAHTIYSKLVCDIEKINQQFYIADDVKITLGTIEKRIRQLKEECKSSAPFSCNVTFSVAENLKQCLDDTVISDFWRNYCFQKISSSEGLAENVLSYTRNLQQAKEYRTRTLSSVISWMSQEQYEYITIFIKNSVSRLLLINYRGYCSTIPLLKDVEICCSEETRLDNDFELILGCDINVNRNISTSLTQKMIISLSERYLLPIFCDSLSFGMYDEVFNDYGRSLHIDSMWYEEMQKTGFSLRPKQDESLAVDGEQANQENIKQDSVSKHEIMGHNQHRRKYDVFISSKSDDYAYAEQVYDFLTEKGLSVFLACRELKKIGNAEYSVAIDDALDETEHMIVICSSARYAKSKWVRYEWSTFDNDKKSGYRDGNLLVILFPEVEGKDLPPALRHQEHIMFSSYKESVLFYLAPQDLLLA